MKSSLSQSGKPHHPRQPADPQDHFRILFETMPLGVVFQGADGVITDANPAAERILGLTREQLQGRKSADPRWKAIHEDGSDFPGETHPSMVALQTGEAVRDVVMGVFNPDLDAYRWINIVATPRFEGASPRPCEVYTTFEDITRRKQAEARLKVFDERFRQIFDDMHEGCTLIGFDWKVLYLNEAAARQYHRGRKDLPGCTLSEINPGVEQTSMFSYYRTCMEQRIPQHFEGRVALPGGTQKWYEFSAYPSSEGIFVLSIDITERKRMEESLHESEERYRQLFNATFDALIVVDAEGRFLDANQTAVERYGYSRQELLDSCVGDLSAPDLREHVPGRLQQTLIEGGQFEWRHRRRDGSEIPVEIAARPLTFRGQLAILAAVRDITERKHRAEKIAFQARLLENVNDAVIATDEHFTITSWNPGAERIYGWKIGEALGRNMVNLLRPQYIDAAPERPGAKDADGMPESREVIHLHQDGREILIESRIGMLHDSAGHVNGYLMVNRDISERKRAEETLRASERKFKALYDIAPVGISLLDHQRRIVESNATLEKITRVTMQGLLAGKHQERKYLRYDGTPMSPDEFASSRAVAENRPIYNIQTGIVTEEGDTIWTEVSAAPLDLPDASVVIVTNDITERKRAEESLRIENERFLRFIESNIIGIVIADADSKIILANDYYLNVLGISAGDFVEGKLDWRKYTPPEWLPADERAYRELKERGICEPYEKEYIRADGTRVPVYIADAVLPGPERQIAGFVLDITSRKRAEAELRHSRDRLAELSRRLVELHETESRAIGRELHDQIGQMLTALKLTLSIVPQLPPDMAAKKLMQSQGLLDELLARVSALSLELRSPVLDDLGLLPALVWHVNRFQEESGILVDFKHSGIENRRFEPQLETTAYRLVQEALTNIARHSRGTRALLEVHVKRDEMQLRVEDDGQGFDPQVAFQHHRGLRGMRERVELVDGSLEVDAQPGGGTKLSIRLPAREGA